MAKIKKSFSHEEIQYLQMIQSNISRMSTSSALFKGFSATIVAGISMISYQQQSTVVLILSFIPVMVFAVLDVYYLKLERNLRYLYQIVREGKHECNYDMELHSEDVKDAKVARIRFVDCVISKSILIFYPIMIIILATVLWLKIKGVV